MPVKNADHYENAECSTYAAANDFLSILSGVQQQQHQQNEYV